MLKKILTVFFISMLPIVELRGAVPVGAAMDLPFLLNYIVCVIGNILPVPFLIMFSKGLLVYLSGIPKIGVHFQKIINKADEKAKKIGGVELLGLFLFVAIPLPGTGAWTGSLIAAILRLRLLPSFLTILFGVMTSGIIMGIISFGLFGIIDVII